MENLCKARVFPCGYPRYGVGGCHCVDIHRVIPWVIQKLSQQLSTLWRKTLKEKIVGTTDNMQKICNNTPNFAVFM